MSTFRAPRLLGAGIKAISLALLLSAVPAAPAFAEAIPTPRLKPAPPSLSQYLTDDDARHLRKGLSAARRGNWVTVKQMKDVIADPTAKDLLTWVRSARDPNVPMDYLTFMVHDRHDWPRMTGIQAKAEAKLFDNFEHPRKMIQWFRGKEPISGEGRAVLARAYFGVGDETNGLIWLKSAWRDSKLTRTRQKELFKRYRTKLTAEDHAARANHLIWLGSAHYGKAEALLPHMSNADRRLMDARMKLGGNRTGINAAVNALPASLRNDPGFLYERARWRRRKKSKEYALPLYLDMNAPARTSAGRSKVWNEKRLMAYWLIHEKKWSEAYQMTQNVGGTSGAAFYEPEFLAGWLKLRKLNDPATALAHFEKLEKGVSTPISLSRAHYWQGRAHEALGDARADGAYGLAANYPNTYYGQLAAARRGGGVAAISLPPEVVSSDAKAAFESDPRIRAMRLLGEAGQERYFSNFAFALDDQLDGLEGLSLLSQVSADYGYMRPSIRAAKQSGRFQSMLTDSGYPLVAPIEALGSDFDTEFVYAIARQESEFAAGAISSAKAYGMMQMINATARTTARRHRVPFDRNRLIADRDYSAKLGALHLHDLLERFDGSYVLSAVGYNAGPTRANQWMAKNGDPRTGEVDPVDWVEMIPFSETRNYVMRVLENQQVYRARRNGDTAPVTIDDDLRFGSRHPAIR